MKLLSDAIYHIREWNELRRFGQMIRAGEARCEPRFREILSLDNEFQPGTVEFAHIERYRFAARHIQFGYVLNAACGSGYGNAILGSEKVETVGLDLYAAPLALASKHFPGAYVQGNVEALGQFPDNTFDAVVSFETIEHVSNSGRAIEEFKRVHRPGGTFVGSIPIMIFHNPGTNYTWRAANELVDKFFPGASRYLQNNTTIVDKTEASWGLIRKSGDKYLLWVWHKDRAMGTHTQ